MKTSHITKKLFSLTIILLLMQVAVAQDSPQIKIVKAQAGDTVAKVAVRHNADPEKVAKYNGLLPNSVLGAGREIRIPVNLAETFNQSPLDELSKIEFEYIGKSDPAKDTRYIRPNELIITIDGTSYFQSRIREQSIDSVGAWVRVVPAAAKGTIRTGRKLIRYHYSLEYYTFDCTDKRISIEDMVFYDAKGDVVFTTGLAMVLRRPVVPNSVGDKLLEYFCQLNTDRIAEPKPLKPKPTQIIQ